LHLPLPWQAMVSNLEEAVVAARRIGFPVMVKASEGGGGKGIRMSASEEELKSHFVQARNIYIYILQKYASAKAIPVTQYILYMWLCATPVIQCICAYGHVV
jgi:biotin carboxylase